MDAEGRHELFQELGRWVHIIRPDITILGGGVC